MTEYPECRFVVKGRTADGGWCTLQVIHDGESWSIRLDQPVRLKQSDIVALAEAILIHPDHA